MQVMIKLSLRLSQFEAIHKVVDTRRERVTIDRGLLESLLRDHSIILAGLSSNYIKYEEPHDPVYDKPRPKLRIRKNK